MKGRLSLRPPWMAQPYSLLGRRPGPAAASAALAAAWLIALLVVAVPSEVRPVVPAATGLVARGDRKPKPAVLLPNGVRRAPGKATLVPTKLPDTTVFGSNWPTWIPCTEPDSWADPQRGSRRSAPTKSGMPLRCATSTRRPATGKPVSGSKVTPTGVTAGGLPMNTFAPLPANPADGIIPTRPVERPNTPPWLNTGLRR